MVNFKKAFGFVTAAGFAVLGFLFVLPLTLALMGFAVIAGTVASVALRYKLNRLSGEHNQPPFADDKFQSTSDTRAKRSTSSVQSGRSSAVIEGQYHVVADS